MEEAKWCQDHQSFSHEHIFTLTSLEVKLWLGYLPSHLGLVQNIVWYCFPSAVAAASPFHSWLLNKDVFFPFSLQKLRAGAESKALNKPVGD